MSASANNNKCTVREVKKRSKKSRTLPGRLKLLTRSGGSCTSSLGDDIDVDRDLDMDMSPPPAPPPTCGRSTKAKSSKLSVFKTPSGQHWCFDVDAYGIYMDFNGDFMAHQLHRPGSVAGGEFIGRNNNNDCDNQHGQTYRSKSLTRQGGSSREKTKLTGTLSSSTRSMNGTGSRTRSRSRLQTMNNSLSQCFGFGSGSSGHYKKSGGGSSVGDGDNQMNSSDLDSEEYYYGSDHAYVRSKSSGGSHPQLDKTFSGSSAFGDENDDDERYCPSGCHKSIIKTN